MAKIAPFAGLRYGPGLRGAMPRLVTPPYDIISPGEQTRFYRSHPCNFIRLEFGRIRPSDHPQNNRYTRAQHTLAEWLRRGVVRRDPQPALYLLQTRYQAPDGKPVCFSGLFAGVFLEPFGEGKVLPHEQTFSGPRTDRFQLLCATGVSFSPVLALYRDHGQKLSRLLGQARKRAADMSFRDWAGSRHQLWILKQPKLVQAIRKEFLGKRLLIADGHHRYLTALKYRQECGAQAGPAADYVMTCLTEMHDPGLLVLPVIRLVSGVPSGRWREFERKLPEYFEVEQIAPSKLLAAQSAAKGPDPVIGYLGDRGKRAWLLRARMRRLEQAADPRLTGHSRVYGRLDVVVLNYWLLETLLGIKPGEEAGRLRFTKSPQEARRCVTGRTAQAAFFPSRPNVEAIWDLARQGETLPQKSTYFLPKVISGLVMNPVGLKE
ncbi:MAG: DUF1015 domain-containing protein [candidate division FCPU426 bacterium]